MRIVKYVDPPDLRFTYCCNVYKTLFSYSVHPGGLGQAAWFGFDQILLVQLEPVRFLRHHPRHPRARLRVHRDSPLVCYNLEAVEVSKSKGNNLVSGDNLGRPRSLEENALTFSLAPSLFFLWIVLC